MFTKLTIYTRLRTQPSSLDKHVQINFGPSIYGCNMVGKSYSTHIINGLVQVKHISVGSIFNPTKIQFINTPRSKIRKLIAVWTLLRLGALLFMETLFAPKYEHPHCQWYNLIFPEQPLCFILFVSPSGYLIFDQIRKLYNHTAYLHGYVMNWRNPPNPHPHPKKINPNTHANTHAHTKAHTHDINRGSLNPAAVGTVCAIWPKVEYQP